MITRKQVETRLETLRVEFEKTKATLEAIHGAILDCTYWLQELDKAEQPTEVSE